MRKEDDSLLTRLMHRPWWVSVVLAGTLYLALATVLPYFFRCEEPCPLASRLFANVASMGSSFAPFALVFLLPGLISAIRTWKERRRPDQIQGLAFSPLNWRQFESLVAEMDWRQFESLVAEIYRRKGFQVRENLRDGPDGGVDLRCHDDDGLFLVQCKHWHHKPVGAKVVRELFGVMAAEGAYGGAVVTSRSFTDDARSFAKSLPIELIDGITLHRITTETTKLRR